MSLRSLTGYLVFSFALCFVIDSAGQVFQSSKVFVIHRGGNISHWLSQSTVRGEKRSAYFTEKDVIAAADAGFDHIRIPIDEEQMWDEAGNKETEAFKLLHNALGWMQKHGLKAIVDLHIIRSHYFLDADPPLFTEVKEQKKFADLWRQLSEELGEYPVDMVAYELLNESVAHDDEDWNRVYKLAYDVVREKEPDRVIFIGPNHFQNVDYFPSLKIPEGDPNIVLSFHFYIPHVITHYKAPWTNIKDYTGPVQYPGIPIDPQDTVGYDEHLRAILGRYTTERIDRDYLERRIQPAIDKARELKLQLYCGEFGCLPNVSTESRNQWYRDIISILEKYNIAWSAWDFKSSGFGVFNPDDLKLAIPEDILFMKM
ncbi:MAG: cellulase family glycosylhydrolase [Saprospiraceae bacterium]|nr:cellulase family glycosylhydrolase [Saprospiraceae bacterium]